jgi:hypothetical protein
VDESNEKSFDMMKTKQYILDVVNTFVDGYG